ncbi:MAG: hypothetical protein WB608_13670 [Terracidiphilus sp.]
MKTRLLFILLLLGAIPVWAQVQPAATGGGVDDERMQMPAPISGESYPMTGTDEVRTNYLSMGVNFIAAYDDNVVRDVSQKPIGDETYSILPNIGLDELTTRQHRSLAYSAGFLFYQPTSALNSVQQSAAGRFQYRLSPRTTFTLSDGFQQSSNPFNQASSISGEPISGSPQPSNVVVIAPYASQYSNGGNVGASYQYSRDGMIGGSGSTALLNYPNPSEAPGLSDFISGGGSGFFSRRLTGFQYLGGIYNYNYVVTHPVDTTTQTQTISLFYTIFVSRTLSVSASGGPLHYDSTHTGVSTSSAWTPSITASLGWQGRHSSLAGSYNRTVTGGGGLLGTYHLNSAGATWNWQYARTWTFGATTNYAITKNATPIQFTSNAGGHSLVGSVYVQHSIGERIGAQAGYSRLNQSYNGIQSVYSAPDSDRVFFSISYQLTRPLGR